MTRSPTSKPACARLPRPRSGWLARARSRWTRRGARAVRQGRRLLDEARQQEDAEHGEGERELCGRDEREAKRGADARETRGLGLAPRDQQLARHRADERPEQHPGQAEEEADQPAQRRARDARPRRAEALRPEGARCEVDEVAEEGDRAEQRERAPADVLEA